ncbi:unnamed protein product [Rotaria magnacalcarata]|uniref:Uncharacterized protein n=2 Tax=Rotaria magnacalcarata TaxID=392030 RepID=A0A8S3C426_9BILA|nr:unnamed protein product [Rotaria magnacalcarata]
MKETRNNELRITRRKISSPPRIICYNSYGTLTNRTREYELMSLFDTHQEDTDDEEENNVNEQEQTDSADVAFVAKLKSSRTLASILKTIDFADVILIIIIYSYY